MKEGGWDRPSGIFRWQDSKGDCLVGFSIDDQGSHKIHWYWDCGGTLEIHYHHHGQPPRLVYCIPQCAPRHLIHPWHRHSLYWGKSPVGTICKIWGVHVRYISRYPQGVWNNRPGEVPKNIWRLFCWTKYHTTYLEVLGPTGHVFNTKWIIWQPV